MRNRLFNVVVVRHAGYAVWARDEEEALNAAQEYEGNLSTEAYIQAGQLISVHAIEYRRDADLSDFEHVIGSAQPS